MSARAPRSRSPLVVLLAALALALLASGANGRLLVLTAEDPDSQSAQQADAYIVQDGQASFSAGSSSSFFGPITLVSPFAWLQQQLMIVDALQQAAMQSLQQLPTATSEEAQPSEQDLLKHVGCARMRAALLGRAAQQQQGQASDASGASAATSAVGVAAASSDSSEAEYYEDYSEGSASSRRAYSKALSSSSSAAAAAAAASVSDSAARVQRLLEDAYAAAYGARGGRSSSSSASSSRASFYNYLDEDEYYDDEEFYYGENDEYYEEDEEEDYGEVLTLADAVLSQMDRMRQSDLDDLDAEWADYLDKAYEYDEEDGYDGYSYEYEYDEGYVFYEYYYTYYDDATGTAMTVGGGGDADLPAAAMAYGEQQTAMALLSHLAELVALSRAGSRGGGFSSSASASSSAFDDSSLPGQPWDGGFSVTVFELRNVDDVFGLEGPQVVDDLALTWRYPDGSVNWGLVTLCILAAGTAAMLIGFVASWLSLRRSMRCRWVYVPRGGDGGCCGGGKGGKGKGCDDLGAPLILLDEEDVTGAVPGVESAAAYVPAGKNESVAKALAK